MSRHTRWARALRSGGAICGSFHFERSAADIVTNAVAVSDRSSVIGTLSIPHLHRVIGAAPLHGAIHLQGNPDDDDVACHEQ